MLSPALLLLCGAIVCTRTLCTDCTPVLTLILQILYRCIIFCVLPRQLNLERSSLYICINSLELFFFPVISCLSICYPFKIAWCCVLYYSNSESTPLTFEIFKFLKIKNEKYFLYPNNFLFSDDEIENDGSSIVKLFQLIKYASIMCIKYASIMCIKNSGIMYVILMISMTIKFIICSMIFLFIYFFF